MSNPDEIAREANRLYWQTDIPVTQLAARLGVSRGTLYNHTQPLAADASCEACGGRLVFRNRSSRDTGTAQCEQCDAEQRLAPAERSAATDAGRTGARSGEGRARGRTDSAQNATAADDASAAGGMPALGILPRVEPPSDPVGWAGIMVAAALVTGGLTALLLRR